MEPDARPSAAIHPVGTPDPAATVQLFRAEALEYLGRQLEGDIVLTRSIPISVITCLLGAITSALVIWVIFGTYARTESVQGIVNPVKSLSEVYADRPGQLTWLGVKEGDFVNKGQEIAHVEVEQTITGGRSPGKELLSSVSEQIKLTKIQLSLEKRSTDTERKRLVELIKELTSEFDQLNSQISLQKQAVESTASNLESSKTLLEKGFETKVSYEQRRQNWLIASGQLAELIQQLAQLSERKSDAQSQLIKLPEEYARKSTSILSELGNLDQRSIDIEDAKSYTIAAPISGQVTSIQTAAGKNADSRRPLLAIIPPHAVMEATLYAPTRAIGMLRSGQPVRLMYDAFPYQHFGTFEGRIVGISRTALAPAEVDAGLKFEEPVYEVRVSLQQQHVNAFHEEFSLQPGMTLTANIVLDRRSFLDWLLEPLRAVEAKT